MVRRISVLGSTGSVGRQTLEVVEHLGLEVDILSAFSNIKLLEEQARRFKPRCCVVVDEYAARSLKSSLADTEIKVLSGRDEIESAIHTSNCEMVFNSISGVAGLTPTLAAIKAKKDIALSNKESLVAAGDIVMSCANEAGVKIIPVDSEHSAIYQCLSGQLIKRILLTCSGGPFYGMTRDKLTDITPERAIAHPVWNMGQKISLDSATLMNKGLEVIEAVHLFDVKPDSIEVLIHRESIIHSMVEYIDNSIIAQLSLPDMRQCVQYAITAPERRQGLTPPIDFKKLRSLNFDTPDIKVFTPLTSAYNAIKRGGVIPAVLNGANERAAELFLDGKIPFLFLLEVISDVSENYTNIESPSLDDIHAADLHARELVNRACQKYLSR